MSNSLDPDQARRFVGPDLGPNCLPRLSAEVTSRQRVKLSREVILYHGVQGRMVLVVNCFVFLKLLFFAFLLLYLT